MKKIIIAIDGFSSCGKSTLAKQLAKDLNYIFIDTGAMYRAITLYFIRKGIDATQKETILSEVDNIHLSFAYDEELGVNAIFLNGENVEKEIREMRVSNQVSPFATIAEVRHLAVEQQQRMGKEKGLVMDGRDIGTVVFPNAELKIFMTASPAVRIERRFKEMQVTNPNITKEEVRKNLEERDYIDSHREVSPLRQAEDARVLDNSNMTREEQLDLVKSWVEELG
ncbi:MAG: (d)CMP kinase [Pseudopedobacter saltans]|uniref:Cytidylate kinase n=1 Tax=Pseudopedobacter saltans TaxID=151895 RepID=A0A2W5H872_9SPHI|nr:MAG: (d)CMP kinase [Pseudopedobacter saltans]